MKLCFYCLALLLMCFSSSAQEITPKGAEFTKKDYREYKKTIDSINKDFKWKEIRDGLYISRNGELGFKGTEVAKNTRITVYQVNFQDSEGTLLSSVVDATTFKKLGGNNSGMYYKDKNHIYHAFPTSSGPNFYILKRADYFSFKIVNDCYAIDKNHVYDIRFGLIEDAMPANFDFKCPVPN